MDRPLDAHLSVRPRFEDLGFEIEPEILGGELIGFRVWKPGSEFSYRHREGESAAELLARVEIELRQTVEVESLLARHQDEAAALVERHRTERV